MNGRYQPNWLRSNFLLSFVFDSSKFTTYDFYDSNTKFLSMTTLLQRAPQDWRDIGGLDTAEEIAHQPAMWRELAAGLAAEQARVAAFLGGCLADPRQRVILTGAGSSAYAGEIIADELNAAWPAQVRAKETSSVGASVSRYSSGWVSRLVVATARTCAGQAAFNSSAMISPA